jgi:hypothetical protein
VNFKYMQQELIQLKFKEIKEKDEIVYEDINNFDIDEFLNYWALQADPRYQKDKKDFDFEQAAGSGDWDY